MDTYGAWTNGHAWLGLDPGETTGWAMIEDGGRVAATGNLAPADLRDGLDSLIRNAHRSGYSLDVVIEKMPRVGGIGSLAKVIDDVMRAVYEVVVQTYDLPIHVVPPGEWKPSRVARLAEPSAMWDAKLSVHQWDAIRMVLYTIDREQRNAQAALSGEGEG